MAASGLKLLFDENFSHRHTLFVGRESGLAEMQHMRHIGWSGEKDKVWIPRSVASGFVMISGDRNDRTREYTVADLKEMSARVLLVGPFWDHLDGWGRAKWLVATIERIVDVAGQLTPGSVSLLDRYAKPRAL